MDHKGRMDAYAIYSFSNLPDEVTYCGLTHLSNIQLNNVSEQNLNYNAYANHWK